MTLLVLLDLSAAFDTVRHDILLDRRLGVTNQALNWFTSYLSDRTQRVVVNGGLPDTFPLAQGVPQGSCLGPLLFTVYTSVNQRVDTCQARTLTPMTRNCTLRSV